jgi:site-specific DNA-methyltransferase (adenine-specific)
VVAVVPDPSWKMHKGDALAVLRDLPDASVDAVITDPPYSSGGAMRGDRVAPADTKYVGFGNNTAGTYAGFSGDNRDQRGYLIWCTLWMTECQRILKPGGTFATFTDWRQLPTTTDAVQAGGLVWRAIAVWDKGIGRPMRGRFRSHIEFVVWATNGPHAGIEGTCLPSILRRSSPSAADRLHMTEKPVALIKDLLSITPPECVVLDPFAGSGTTGVAALNTGRQFIGVEITEHFHEMASARLAKAALSYQPPLFGGVA